ASCRKGTARGASNVVLVMTLWYGSPEFDSLDNTRVRIDRPSNAVIAALAAAALFGASTPLAKQFVDDLSALLLAGLLYLGSGVGLLLLRLLRDKGWQDPGLTHQQWPWLLAAIACGGVLAPTLLMLGLARMSAASASLLLNLEGVLTALLAWMVFKEATDRRVVVGMLLIALGAALLAWPGATELTLGTAGAALVVLACLCWAIDNNLTRQVAKADALFIAGLKGLSAGVINMGLALTNTQSMPAWGVTSSVLLIGFLGYGLSLALFVVALRHLGSARTGAYFSAAPFIGAAIALGLFHEATSSGFWAAGILMAAGLYLHLTERHEHPHWHGEMQHSHAHFPDVEHRHEHR
ncbi:MAG: DMT family transporter, partial [Comamonadaceae bacterium]